MVAQDPFSGCHAGASLGWAAWSLLMLGLGLPITPGPDAHGSHRLPEVLQPGQQGPELWPAGRAQAGTEGRGQASESPVCCGIRGSAARSLPADLQPASGITGHRPDVCSPPRKAAPGSDLRACHWAGAVRGPEAPNVLCSSFPALDLQPPELCLTSVMRFLQLPDRRPAVFPCSGDPHSRSPAFPGGEGRRRRPGPLPPPPRPRGGRAHSEAASSSGECSLELIYGSFSVHNAAIS